VRRNRDRSPVRSAALLVEGLGQWCGIDAARQRTATGKAADASVAQPALTVPVSVDESV
jgi:hypothetical protein